MKKAMLPALAAGFVLAFAPAHAALNSYMRVTGETQGDIKGSVTQAGREDSIMVIAFEHEVVSPRDAASGLPTGRRRHAPLIVTAPIDKSTPLLFNAMANNENLTNVTLRMYKPSRTGKEEQYYTIELVNATVASIRMESGASARDEHKMIVGFAYQKIVETWEDGGITAEDDWAAPVN